MKKLIIILILLFPLNVFGAISHVETDTTIASASSPYTLSSHVVSGTNPALIVKLSYKSNNPDTGITVVWDVATENQSFTKLIGVDGGNAQAELWYLEAPVVKTADITITAGSGLRLVASAASYSGVDQTNPFRIAANNSNTGSDNAPTVDITALNGEVVVDSLSQVSAGPHTATEAHTPRHNDAATGGGTDTRGASQEKSSTGAVETMSWSMSGSDDWGIVAGALQEPQVPPEGIAFDFSNSGAAVATSLTFAHTNTGDDLLLFVGGYSDQTPSSVKYNDVTMTEIESVQTGVRLFYLIDPTIGNNNVVFTSGSSGTIWYASASYTGARQSGVPDASDVTTISAAASANLSVTTVADNAWTVAAILANNGGLTAGSGTSDVEPDIDGIGRAGFFDSGAAITPAGSHTMNWTFNSGSNGGIVMASFAPVEEEVGVIRQSIYSWD